MTTVRHDMESVGEIIGRLANEVKARETSRPRRGGKGEMMTSAFCPGCGAARAAGAKFCPTCGARFDLAGWGLENPAGIRPMVVNPLVLWLFVVGGIVLGLLFASYVLGNLLTGLPLIGALIACPIIGAAFGSWAATNLLR